MSLTIRDLRQERPESVVRTYYERWNAHDTEGMLALLEEDDDGLVYGVDDGSWGLMRHGLVLGEMWSYGAGVGVSIITLETREDVVHVVYEQKTRVDELLDVGSCRLEWEVTVRDGIIRKVIQILSCGNDGRDFLDCRRQALKPFVRWVEERRPWEAEDLLWKGKLNTRGDSLSGRYQRGRRVVELLEAYQSSSEASTPVS